MADYTGYTDTFKGSLIGSETEFDNAAIRVKALLNSFTSGRFEAYAANEETAHAADTAIYAMCECFYKKLKEQEADAAHTGIASENTDGYSVSYSRSGGDISSKSFQQSMCVMAKIYLPAYLFYRGVCSCDY